MISITFPDKSTKKFRRGITGSEIALSISKSLANAAIAIEINGSLVDMSFPIKNNSCVRILTLKEQEVLTVIRNDAAYITAQAVKELFPESQIIIGTVTKDGFYYDFAKPIPFSYLDLERIETRMHEIVKQNKAFIRQEVDKNKAINIFKAIGENYKSEIISLIPENEKIILYKQGNFIDLCRGPHSPSTSKIKYFKLLKVSGVYWKGDKKNEMLQRVYGTAWATKEQLDNYLYILKELEQRDHRKLGHELNFFHFQEEAQGMVFWHPKGYAIYRIIESYIRKKLEKESYLEVKTPIMLDKKLWEASGHWEKFQENMFIVKDMDKLYALKPMNCPCHIQIYKQGIKSYRDLPIRIAEFGCCHRNEATGGLHGLFRVRSFVQDDAHIFCSEEQINTETIAFCNLLREVYSDFGFKEIKIKFSDRPMTRAGNDDIWDKAESSLKAAIENIGFDYEINHGEGAFYGPKLEFVLTDAVGRDWQCGTLQIDFVLPELLNAEYIAASGQKKKVVMLHRAIIGTFERFIGILIEHYSGYFPLWLVPTQIVIFGVNNELDNYIIALNKKFIEAGIRSDLDISKEKVNYKIRNLSKKKIPLIGLIGEKELQTGTIAIRKLGSINKIEILLIDEVIKMITNENKKYLD